MNLISSNLHHLNVTAVIAVNLNDIMVYFGPLNTHRQEFLYIVYAIEDFLREASNNV